jgi:hypothetical protein
MANAYYANQYISTTLASVGGITDSATTGIILASITNIETDKPGIACLTYTDPIDTSIAEWIIYTSIDSGTKELQGVTRGQEGFAAKAHSNGATVAFPISKSHINNLNDALIIGGAETNLLQGILDEDDMASDSAVKAPTQQSVKAYSDIYSNANFNAPDGFLINGKIVPSVASNNLTVAIKGMDGNDPSASNPVYVRIGDTIRSITAALSVTKNAGTNWFDSGSAAFATQERDYFVYLGYNATDGVVVGFSTINHGRLYSSFSATSTAEQYCAISTITNAAAGDNYVNVGRFAATLSAGAGYTWTVPTFTAINLIQRPIFETRFLTYVPVIRGDGTAGTGTYSVQGGRYKLTSNVIDCSANMVWSNITGSPTGALAGSIPMTSNAVLAQEFVVNLFNVTYPASTIQVFGEMVAVDTMVHFYAMRDGSTNTAVAVDTAGGARYNARYEI